MEKVKREVEKNVIAAVALSASWTSRIIYDKEGEGMTTTTMMAVDSHSSNNKKTNNFFNS